MALAINWKHRLDIMTVDDLMKMISIFKEIKPDYSGLDSETNGLHIIYNTPFLISFGFYNEKTKEGATFSYDLERSSLNKEDFFYTLYKICNKTIKTVIHNAKFDMHMLTNIGYKPLINSITDCIGYIRLAHDSIPIKHGGVNLKLKDYAKKWIDPSAKFHEQKLTNEKGLITKRYNSLLVERFKQFSNPPKQYHPKNTNPKTWTKGVLEKFFKDVLNEPEDLPDPKMTVQYYEWKNSLPDKLKNNLEKCLVHSDSIPYDILDRENITLYAHYDIIYMLEAFHQCKPILIARCQEKTLKLEEDLIEPLYEMERIGFNFNLEYAVQSKDTVKDYIRGKRSRLIQLAGQSVTVGQHKVLAEIIESEFDIDTDGTGNDKLEALILETDDPLAIEFINIIMELRTLEKWYSTYLIKWIESSQVNRRVYTTINQFAAASARVSSDFQQFPKEELKDDAGNVLFHPRKLIQATGGDFESIAYLDYSQIELRIQALYTIFVSGGDTNLCRAYMPFKCYYLDEMNNQWEFNYNNPKHLETFNQHVWLHNEDGVEWHPTDLHDKTTLEAFPGLTIEDPQFKALRKMGKSGNFCITYGGTDKTLNAQFKFGEEISKAIYNGYKKAYPHVMLYKKYVYDFLRTKPYIENLFNRRYYGINGHKGCNYLIQGSSADFLKIKIIEVTNFIKENKLKSRFQMNIHDELIFELFKNEEYILPQLKAIMENLPGTKIPIVVEVEITKTTWDEKEKYTYVATAA